MSILTAGPQLGQGERVSYTILANHSSSSRRAVGGRLFVTNQSIQFSPHRLDALLRAKRLRIELADVEAVQVKAKDGSDLFGGGLRDRLQIRTPDNTFVFVVNRVDERIEELKRSVENNAKRRLRSDDLDSP